MNISGWGGGGEQGDDVLVMLLWFTDLKGNSFASPLADQGIEPELFYFTRHIDVNLTQD